MSGRSRHQTRSCITQGFLVLFATYSLRGYPLSEGT